MQDYLPESVSWQKARLCLDVPIFSHCPMRRVGRFLRKQLLCREGRLAGFCCQSVPQTAPHADHGCGAFYKHHLTPKGPFNKYVTHWGRGVTPGQFVTRTISHTDISSPDISLPDISSPDILSHWLFVTRTFRHQTFRHRTFRHRTIRHTDNSSHRQFVTWTFRHQD